MSKEIWKQCPSPWSEYEASTTGRIRRDGKVMKQVVNQQTGYLSLKIVFDDDVSRTINVHKIIAYTFLGKPKGLVINHINQDKLDNRLENLEYVSQSANIKAAAAAYRMKNNPCLYFNENGKLVEHAYSLRDLALKLGFKREAKANVVKVNKELYEIFLQTEKIYSHLLQKGDMSLHDVYREASLEFESKMKKEGKSLY